MRNSIGTMTPMDEWDFDDRRSSARDLIHELGRLLPERSVARAISRRSKMPFKVEVLAGSLAWRIDELVRSALISYDGQMHVAGIVTIRAAMETAAVLDGLRALVGTYVGGDVEGLDERLMTGIFGSRTRDDRPSSPNVLGAIDKVARRIPAFRANYDELSEYVHPNDAGTTSAFVRLHRDGHSAMFTTLGENPRRRAWTLIESIGVTLILAIEGYVDLRDRLPGFVELCDRDCPPSS